MEALNIELDTVQKEKNDTVSGLREKNSCTGKYTKGRKGGQNRKKKYLYPN